MEELSDVISLRPLHLCVTPISGMVEININTRLNSVSANLKSIDSASRR